ncbi:hypothetical protein [Sphingomonas sp. ACRSK]|uniref:hypothetical protein n=1 Tax=Sphingomonas sp. ACRSK TaxID=2918213 RepID=UPI001EF575FE|nr:hypothetical protein [Sphingomonas sp. ACRSK]MCG7346611.1 hypothetical protein [Sphingomonas sp. ACRSK]
MSIVQRIRRHAPWLEPWYDWGKTTTWRLDQVERDFSDEAEGEVWLIEIQWFGLHLGIQLGRQPRKITPEQVAANKRRAADLERNGI